MNAFEHVLVLLSFVFALAIAHILSSTAALIRESRRVRFSGIHALWVLNAIMVVIGDWLSFWDLRSLQSWDIGTIFFTFGLGFSNYLFAALVCPEIPAEGVIDLVAFHDSQGRKYLSAFLVCCLFALVANTIYGGIATQWNAQNLAVVPMIAMIVAALIVKARWMQWTAPVLMLCTWALYFGILQSALK